MEKKARIQHLQHIREYELQQALRFFPATGKILEIGAGSGWQAQRLTQYGYEVVAIDVPDSRYSQSRIFPVVLYDGISLPFSDHSFDIIFSSNVLEHISEPIKLNKEIRRVLSEKGIAIHVVPTTTWRLWTILTHHFYICRLIINFIKNRILQSDKKTINELYPNSNFSYLDAISSALWPQRHGEHGTALYELYLFSKKSWSCYFINYGWTINSCRGIGLFYTGNQIFYSGLKFSIRKILAKYLGSSTMIFILTPN